VISFPPNYYDSDLGLGNSFDCYKPHPTKVACSVSNYEIHVPIGGALAKSVHKIRIDGIKNPSKAGGAGVISMATRIGINVIDQNKHFALVGFYSAAVSMTSGSVALDTEKVVSGSD
jgi:hypothetical protein